MGALGPKLWAPYVKMWWYHARVWQRRIYVLAILGASIKNHSPHMSSLAWYMYVYVNIIQYLHMCIAVMKSPRSVSLQLKRPRNWILRTHDISYLMYPIGFRTAQFL